MMGAKNILMISDQCQTGNEFGVLRQKRELNERAYSTKNGILKDGITLLHRAEFSL